MVSSDNLTLPATVSAQTPLRTLALVLLVALAHPVIAVTQTVTSTKEAQAQTLQVDVMGNLPGSRITGEIIEVDQSDKTFTLKTDKGRKYTMDTENSTELKMYHSTSTMSSSFSNLTVGTTVTVDWKPGAEPMIAKTVRVDSMTHQRPCSRRSCECSKAGKCKPRCDCGAEKQ